MCKGWINSFEKFINDIGARPSSLHSIDRVDNNKNYSCGNCDECIENGWVFNCRWATKKQQGENTRKVKKHSYDGIVMNQSDWSAFIGIDSSTLIHQLSKKTFDETVEFYIKKKPQFLLELSARKGGPV